MSEGLTDRELAAGDLTRDLAVTAGAGSGKTTVLVRRFVAIARDPSLGPERVLAITFTRKAAVEIKERVIRELELAGEVELRRRTEAAYISTIHGFAERMLRERPFDARIDPAFSVLTPYQQELFFAEALQAMAARPDLRALARRVGRELRGGWRIFSIVREVATLRPERSWPQRERDLPGDAAVEADEADLLLASDDLCVERAIRRAREFAAARERGTIACLRTLIPLVDGATFKSRGKYYADAMAYLETARACVACGSPADYLDSLPSTRFTAGIEAGERPGIRACLDRLKALTTELRGLDWEREEALERELLPLKHAIYDAARQVDEGYAEHKRRLGVLDFHDLQLRARDLLAGNESVRRGYAERFRHILLDESQDTDELQYAILHALRTPENTLFLVGDPKQSIYEFRGANPDVFHRAVGALPEGGRLTLAENFRSRPEIVSFINGVGPALLGDRFVHFEARADYGGEWLDAPAVTALYAERQQIATGDGERAAHEPLSVGREREAAAVAEEIVRLLREHTPVRDPDAKELRWVPLQPRHIALLFRSRGVIPYFERALAERGVPYVTAAGQGFYERAEVLDCLTLLRAAAQPLDDLAMAALLRSPFCGATDADLWRLREPPNPEHGRPPIWDALAGYPPLEAFRRRFSDFRNRMRGCSAAELLREGLREFAYEAALAGHHDGPAMLANVAKLRRQLAELGPLSATEACRELERTRALMPDESIAPLVGAADDVVILTTLHQAKGLEWPIVCLPDLQPHSHNKTPGFSARHRALLCGLRDAAEDAAKPLSVIAMVKEVHEREEAEERRLLYVGLTRARERLILSACVKPKQLEPEAKHEQEFRTPLEFLLLHTDGTLAEPREHDCGSYRTVVTIEREPVTRVSTYRAGATLAARLRPVTVEHAPAEPMLDAARPLSLAVTSLLGFRRCPQVFRLAKELSIREHLPRRAAVRRGEEGRLSGVELGTRVHDLLERARFDAADCNAEVERLLSGEPEAWRPSLARMLRPVLEGQIGESVRSAARVEREWPFVLDVDGVLLEGVIDLAIQAPDGSWTIVDYKSNDHSRRGTLEYLIDHYTPQLELYALAMERAGTGVVRDCALVFLTGPVIHRWPLSGTRSSAEPPSWVRTAVARIASGDYTTTPGPKCDRCGYRKREVCDTGRTWIPSAELHTRPAAEKR